MAPLNAVIDLSHHNGNVNLNKAKSSGILGVLHKASQGQSFADPAYRTNRNKATQEGLLWGAYHFGTGSDGVRQAEYFLRVVGDPEHTLLVLDFEPNLTGPSMDLEEARAFVTHVNAETGKFPGLYSGHFIKDLLGTRSDPVLAQCWLWLAQYASTPVVSANWRTWTMWQYTDGGLGPDPHTVPGVGRCDRDKFNGTADELARFWPRQNGD